MKLLWPGIDQRRADAVCFHLIRCVQLIELRRHLPDVPQPWQATKRTALTAAVEHERIARGYFGAIGFEANANQRGS